MRAETRIIINNYYDGTDKKLFESFSKIIENDYKNKETQGKIWK